MTEPTVEEVAAIERGPLRKRNWRGQFVKNLRQTPEDSREWLIWSRYHCAWHRRSNEGGACGYASDIAEAGIFVRSKANSYNDGDRNEAFHVSEKLPQIKAAIARHEEALANLRLAADQALRAHLNGEGERG